MSTPRSDGAKSFDISKWVVWEAYRKVKANRGAAGVDEESIAEFEGDLKGNLYKLWNRMSSGTYFPPPVLAVQIPKAGGNGVRTLGVPTVSDRIAQTVVRLYLEPVVEPMFHPDSYGYRPGRSALNAVEACRRRCWSKDWVIDLDIRAFFDSLDHELILKAVAAHTRQRWILLYLRRWLQAPLQRQDGTLVQRDRGTAQGSAISPLLANLFLHYALDRWLAAQFSAVSFERYADDAVVHCVSKTQAETVLGAITDRMAQVGLELHPDKTRIVYCKDGTVVAGMSTSGSISSGSRFVRDWPRASTGTSSSASSRRSATTPRKRSGGKSAAGGSTGAVTRPSPTLPDSSIRSCKAGSTTTGASTSPGCTRSCDASTSICCVGPPGNTSGCAATCCGQRDGCKTSPDANQPSSRTGG